MNSISQFFEALHPKIPKSITFLILSLVASLASLYFLARQKYPPESKGNNSSSQLAKVIEDSIPALQMLVPGFSVSEIPVSLNNLNVVRYGKDGRLYALAYDGHIYVLTDTDGDGIEDKAEPWWDKQPLIMPVGMVLADEGIYVTSKGKVSLLKDNDKNGKAETEEIITDGWVEPVVYTGTTANGVDAFGIALDKEGSLFFALGTADFTRAYMVDSLGKPHYDIKSERGTILKVKPGSNKRQIFVTGTRFPVSMAFNEKGDLFATDQEGATWLPNGNPYDELLHIEQGRHYGFPPRHPKFLPDVIDEPSVFDYKPQHQSTCGLIFNIPQKDGKVFGPDWWKNNAFVCGYSRGKIYRTQLLKTASGYVSQSSIIASSPYLTVDAGISPDGDMVVATHSGPPDWGFGPSAKGKLYKIKYTGQNEPQPVRAWASAPDTVKVAFDKVIPKEYLQGLEQKIVIEYGEFAEAADRLEVQRPGYHAVERQARLPKAKLAVKSVEVSEDGQTLLINTVKHTEPVTYAIMLPGFDKGNTGRKVIAQIPNIDISYKLNGVEITTKGTSGQEKGWMPHLDLAVSRAFLGGSEASGKLQALLENGGDVILRTKLNLNHMLRPDVQPEASVDYQLSPEDVTLVFNSSVPLSIKADSATVTSSEKKKTYETKLSFRKVIDQPYSIEISFKKNGRTLLLNVSYFTNEDPRPRALQPSRFILPWLEKTKIEPIEMATTRPELEGGNWARGKKLFFGEATCSNCHSVEGEGKAIGPDLSNLIYRDYASVLRDIQNPNATINPDYVNYSVKTHDGRTLSGLLASKKDSLTITDAAGNRTSIPRNDVVSFAPLSVSMMPPGLSEALGEQKMKDLMTYMLSTMQPAKLEYIFLPPIRKVTELHEVLAQSTDTARLDSSSKMEIVWVTGPKDHGPDEHDYPLQSERWEQLLAMEDNVHITKVNGWPSQEQFDKANVIVFYWDYPKFNEENGKQLDAFLERGGGLVYSHYAVDATENPKALADRIGLAWKGGASKFRHGPVELDFSKAKHPITHGFKKTTFNDESYWELVKGDREIQVLASGMEEGKEIPLLWTTTHGKGRVFVSILGHFNWTFDDPLFRLLMLRAIAWSGHQPVNRLEDLTTIGARYTE